MGSRGRSATNRGRAITATRGPQARFVADWSDASGRDVLPLLEQKQPGDSRPRGTIEVGRSWIRGEIHMRDAHRAAFVANAAGRGLPDPAKFAARATGQAVAVAHVAAHELGAAACAICAASASSVASEAESAPLRERDWQREKLPAEVKDVIQAERLYPDRLLPCP